MKHTIMVSRHDGSKRHTVTRNRQHAQQYWNNIKYDGQARTAVWIETKNKRVVKVTPMFVTV